MILAGRSRASPRATSLLLAGMLIAGLAAPADARVRFGRGVLIGGHDFSDQTYGPGRRAVINLYRKAPPHPGCRWHPDRHGGRVKVCHLQTRPRPRR